jgi:23S rRNA (adenine1618-N6)-methyltransferase
LKKRTNLPSNSSDLPTGLDDSLRYNFDKLIEICPELTDFVFINRYGNQTINFFNAKAVKLLNKALLKKYYGIDWWEIPEGFLCPPVPSRALYIQRVSELITPNVGDQVRCLDIGVGANCIYPLVGVASFGWHFVGSDSNVQALESAQKIIDHNINLKDKIVLRRQSDERKIFSHIIQPNEYFDLSICNPPFHSSSDEAGQVALRKVRNLSGKKLKQTSLNFGGRNNELWCPGGERQFIETMILESKHFSPNVGWFTTLVSKGDNLPYLKAVLKKTEVAHTRVIELQIGNKIARILCWTFSTKN